MNSVNLIGNLGKDNELKFGQTGTAVLNQSLAVRRAFKDKQSGEYETDWINLVMFGKTAENFANFTKKGSKVGIEGRIQSGSYENQQGQKIYTTEIFVNQFHLLEPKNSNSSGYNQNQGNYQPNNNQTQQPPIPPQNQWDYNKDANMIENFEG